MTQKKISFALLAFILLWPVDVEPQLQNGPLLKEMITTSEQPRRIARAVGMALSPLRNAATEPPILPVVLKETGGVESDVLKHIHGELPPLVVVTTTSLNARRYIFAKARGLPRPRHVLLLMGGETPARLHLLRLLNTFRASPLWVAGAQQVVALTDLSTEASSELQRALARSGVLRAFGISTTKNATPIAIHFNTPQRPSRAPKISKDLKILGRRVDLQNVPVIFAFVTKDSADEASCMSGNVKRSYSAMDIYISFLIERSKVRAFCFSKAGVMDMPIEFVVKLPGGPNVPPGYDIDVVGVATSLTGSLGLDFLYPHAINNLCLYARRAQPLPFVQSLLGSFSPNTWIATFVVLISICFVRVLARDVDGFSIALEVWRTFLTGAFRENRRVILLAIGLGTSLFSVIVTTAFLSNASSFLSVPPNEAELRTLQDVIRRIKHIYCIGSDVEGFKNSSVKDEVSILSERFQLQPSQLGIYVGAYKSAFSPDKAILIPDELHFFLTNRKDLIDDGFTRLRQVDECVVTALPRSYLAKKHSQFTDIFETILQRAFQAGILRYISERHRESAISESHLESASTGSVVYRPYALGLDQLWGAFFALGCGILLSILTFSLEKSYRAFFRSKKVIFY